MTFFLLTTLGPVALALVCMALEWLPWFLWEKQQHLDWRGEQARREVLDEAKQPVDLSSLLAQQQGLFTTPDLVRGWQWSAITDEYTHPPSGAVLSAASYQRAEMNPTLLRQAVQEALRRAPRNPDGSERGSLQKWQEMRLRNDPDYQPPWLEKRSDQ